MFVSQQKKEQVSQLAAVESLPEIATAAAPPSSPNSWLSQSKKSGEEKSSDQSTQEKTETATLDFSQHVVAVIGPTLCLIAPHAEDRDSRDISSTLILTRFNDDFDTGFVRLAGACAACGGRDYWVAKKTPQQRRQEAERGGNGSDRTARYRFAAHCANCRPIRVAALSLGRLVAVEVKEGDVMWRYVALCDAEGRGWVWDTAVEDELMRRAARKNGRGVASHDWPLHDEAMGIRVVEK